ncbi:MAG: LD-carboxypeptidase [Turicibacter sp.]|nr:LD-carboxypeptidase [Turicibacter sp.]
MIEPKPLRRGGTIAIVAPSGPLEAETVFKGEELLKEMGFDVIIAPSCFEKKGYLAGLSDRQRAEDIMMMFADEEVDAVLCMRGGYGCNRIIPYLEHFKFEKYPKPFIGYSDITYLHIFLNQFHQLITYHGPMLKDLLTKNQTTTQHFLETIMGEMSFDMIDVPYYNRNLCPASGILVGGNLTIICSTLGTPYEIDTCGKILFIEEVNEPVYAIDRLLMQLKYSGKLDDAAGIILGDFNVYDKKETDKLLRRTFRLYNKPIAYNIPSGHCKPIITLPLGSFVTLNPSNNSLSIQQGENYRQEKAIKS